MDGVEVVFCCMLQAAISSLVFPSSQRRPWPSPHLYRSGVRAHLIYRLPSVECRLVGWVKRENISFLANVTR